MSSNEQKKKTLCATSSSSSSSLAVDCDGGRWQGQGGLVARYGPKKEKEMFWSVKKYMSEIKNTY